MSKFTTPAILELLGYGNYRLHDDFSFYPTDNPDDVITVPTGFETNLASIPRVFWGVICPVDKPAKAAIIHDWLYTGGKRPRKECDRIFLDGMTVLGVAKWKRWVMYWCVRLFGRSHWG